MKVVDVAEFYAEKGGGVRTYVEQKLEAGERMGHEVVVVAPGPEDGERAHRGGRIVWVKSPPVPGDPRYHLFTRPSAIHRVLDREAPDVVEGSSVYGGGWAVSSWPGNAAKSLIFHQDPVAVFGHSFLDRYLAPQRIDWVFSGAWAYLRWLGGRFDTTVVAGAWLRDRLTSFGVPRVQSVPFGIDAGPFAQARPDPEVRRQLLQQTGRSDGATLLVCVSRHHPEKRLSTVIEAVRRLGEALEVGLVVFGDGPQRAQIQRLAHRTPGVWVAGFTRNRQELATALASADALIHGSAAETFGLVVAEALAAGTPVVVPNSGGAADLARPDVAETYAPGDAESCAAAVRRLQSRDRKALRAAGHQASRKVRSMDDHFRDLFAHYRSLLEPPPSLA